jgi:hypothetical protein
MKDDPVIRRIREARQQISKACDHDPGKVVEYYMDRQKQHQDRLVTPGRDAEPERKA